MTGLVLAVIPELDPLPLPAPTWLLWALLLLTFTLHLIAMNVVLGGSIIAAVARLRGGEDGMQFAKAFAKMLPTTVAATVTLGVAPLLFLQTLYGRLFFSSAVLIAWYWLAIVPILICAYYGTYWIAFRQKKDGRFAILSAIIALFFMAIAFIQSTNMTLMLRADQFLPKFLQNARGSQLNLDDPTFLGRYLHMLFGAIAVGGMAVAIYGTLKRRENEAHGDWAIRFGALWFVGATIANILTGLWWFGQLPRPVLVQFMGTDVLASLALGGGIALGFMALGTMFTAIGGGDSTWKVRLSAWTLVATLVCMILARDGVRRAMLEQVQFQPAKWIEPQWGVIGIFLALLVAGLGVVAWMVKMYVSAGEPEKAKAAPQVAAEAGS